MIGTKQQIQDYLQDKSDDDIFEVKKKQTKSIRTLAMVRYYWGVIVAIISDFHGMSPIETNESLKLLFKKETFTDLDTVEFKFVIESIIEMWKTKYDVDLPLPNDVPGDDSLFKSLGF